MTTQHATPRVYAAIAGAMEDIAKEGISKARKNDQQGYKFRGIDDVYNALAPILAKHKLCVIPQVLKRDVVERQTQRGGVLFYVTCEVRFMLVSAEDGTSIEAITYGEAMDSGDKATNKAMSAAYKYMAMQTFCIPTEGDNDADATTHQVIAEKPPTASAGASGRMSAAQAKRDGEDAKIKAQINACDLAGLLEWETHFDAWTAHLPLSWADPIRDMIEMRREELMTPEPEGAAELDAAFRATVGQQSPSSVARPNGALV